MTGLTLLIVIVLVFAVSWIYLARRPGPRARIGPDGTNVRNPESFVVHHEGKAQGLDIANTALKERTRNLSRDLPGAADQVKAPIPGREMVAMDEPPSDVSKYGDEKVAPGAVPGAPGAESKAKVLMEGPRGSRPETPEEPGSPHAKGRRVTDIHRDVPITSSTTGEEPGYGLGRTHPGETDGEGAPAQAARGRQAERGDGPDPTDQPPGPMEQPEMQDDLTDVPNGQMPAAPEQAARSISFQADFEVGEEVVSFRPDREDWALLRDHPDLPDQYGEDLVTAIVRNPRSLYVYWEVSGHAAARLRTMLGGSGYRETTPCLRVFDVETEGSFTVELGEHDTHWFVNDLEPGHRYVIAYERRSRDGRYYLLALSGPVAMPLEGAAGQGLLYERLAELGRSAGSPWG